MADKPMNPFADVDFANAMKESFRRWTPTMMEFADEHVNRAVVDYSYNGAENCRWASEIEEFPIAVCKKHFGDEDAGIEGDIRDYL